MMKLSVTIEELFEKDVESVPQEKRFDLNVVSEALWHCTEILRAVNNPERRSELLTHFLASQPSIPPGRYMEKVEEDNRTLRSTIPPCAQDDPPNNLPFNGEETYVIEPRSTISKGEQRHTTEQTAGQSMIALRPACTLRSEKSRKRANDCDPDGYNPIANHRKLPPRPSLCRLGLFIY